MFLGSYKLSIDAKRRFIVPAKFRTELGLECVLFKGFEDCLYMYPGEAWKKFLAEHVENRPDEDKDAMDLKFLVYNNSCELKVDSQGRVNVPDDYLEFAEITKDMVQRFSAQHRRGGLQ
jgi:MraZ protein